MADLLIGLDVGTTATKALLFDLNGNVVASASRGYGLRTPRPGWVEQDPEEIWRAVVETLRSLSLKRGPHDRVLALGQSSQGGTTIPVDAGGRLVHHAFSWLDQRADEEAKHVRATWGDEPIRVLTGWPLISGLPLEHIAWFRRHCPAQFAAAERFLFVNDFIGCRLTGQLCMDPSDASITQLMNIAAGDWDERLLEVAGIERRQLSPIQPSGVIVGRITQEAAAATGLPQDTLVVNGAHDQYCAAVGAGVTWPGRVLLSCGTAWVLLTVPENLATGLSSGMAISRHAVEGRWGAIRSLGGVGASLEWLLDHVWGGAGAGKKRERLYDAIDDAAARTPPGAGGVLFLPMAGGHAASYGPAGGGFLNLAISHTRDHLARAIMEGTACELRWAVDEMQATGIEVAELTMVGGAAKSPVWPQIVADILHVPVTVPSLKDAATRGAAILAGVGAGCFSDAEAGFAAWRGPENRLSPTVAHRQFYDERYVQYQATARLMASRAG